PAATVTSTLSLHDALPIYAQAFLVQRLDGFDRRVLDAIGHADQAGVRPLDGDEHHRLTIAAQRVRAVRRARRRPHFAHHRRVAKDRKSTRLNSSHVKISYA